MKLHFILPVLMTATIVKGFNIHDRIQPDVEYSRPMEQMTGDYPAAFSQDHIQPEQAIVMYRRRYAVGVASLIKGQTVEVVYKTPSAGRVFVNLVNDVNNVVLSLDARYDWPYGEVSYIREFVLSIYTTGGGWQKQAELHNFPFPCNGQRTTITLQITVQENDFLVAANGVDITTFEFRDLLTPDTVREITVTLADAYASTTAKLEKISVSY